MPTVRILGIETSCDENSAAVLYCQKGRVQLLSNIVASSASTQAKYGGVVPEQAAREQLKSIIPVITEALNESGIIKDEIDAIAVTYGPGLIGSLLVGVETAKVLALVWNKKLIAVNHLLGHLYANWIEGSQKQTVSVPKFPIIGLLVSGGHTDIIEMTPHGKYKYLGGTRDDAAGECFDKCARLLNLSYPGGPQISKLAQNGDPSVFDLPKPMLDSGNLDLSFSGLKTAVANLIKVNPQLLLEGNPNRAHLAASIEQTIAGVLVKKLEMAVDSSRAKQVMVAGGVAANQKLAQLVRETFQDKIVFIPRADLCTDNAAMIASAGYFNPVYVDPLKFDADPSLSLAY
ncbi:tRNA (adenosine(37)-N6)-threonylcarbamoyltransferase complex transferase subunit TsaD [Candidatus Daviesbacteria bacterium]|nr:tRNA (adenosine(37)-N6)-threonylcarbamoyltransferase complex transferase subunit TsaD [Candidatus Daviesbacteria bacterium]